MQRSSLVHRLALLGLSVLLVLASSPSLVCSAQEKQAASAAATSTAKDVVNDTLVLVSPLASEYVYLIDSAGNILHQWKFSAPGSNAYLFPDGTLMRSAQEPETQLFAGRGSAGRIQKVDWDGTLLWDFKYASESHLQHHDYQLLPNGNVLLIAWEKISKADALAVGRSAQKLDTAELYGEKIVEIQPQGKTGGKEVWVWRLRDHLVQNEDASKPNFGKPSEQPRRVDINYAKDGQADWIHMNALDYHPGLDQIVLSPRYFDELWFIDHSTTSQEAAASTGGRHGHGGDLLYRLGNPLAYGQGKLTDKILFGQHNCLWIPAGIPGAGDITVFNNGTSEPRSGYSSVDQFKLPVDAGGKYRISDSGLFEAPEIVWSYSRGPEMFSFRISGAERLANGNTLICSGDQPWILEVTADKQVVWETKHRYGGPDGNTPNTEKGAMFRAPGYTASYLLPALREKLNRPE
jgi:Arylsulfotransferase (ASST)